MRPLTCLIVEDEPLAAEILEDYIRQTPRLTLVSSCPDALYALEALQQQSVDVLFLDVHLPKLKGLDFLRSLRRPPQVILTTAYHQYALESYDLNVVDYLLKPIDFPRFLRAVAKLQFPRPTATLSADLDGPPPRPFRFFNVNKKMVRVFLDEILYIESLKEYVRIVTADRAIVTLSQLGEIERLLDEPNFLRIHRSYLVAVPHIEAFNQTTVEVGGHSLPIGRTYQVKVEDLLRELMG